MVREHDGLPPMPEPNLRHRTDADLPAVHEYSASLGEAGGPVPPPRPPGKTPTTPSIIFDPVFPAGAAGQ